jgi:ribonuclease P protein component
VLSKQHRLPIGGFPIKARTLFRGRVVLAKTAINTLGFLRVGVLASRKNIKNAVTRNALRRIVLDNFALFINKPKNIGTDLLIIVTTPIIKLDLQTTDKLLQDLEAIKTLLSRTKSIK